MSQYPPPNTDGGGKGGPPLYPPGADMSNYYVTSNMSAPQQESQFLPTSEGASQGHAANPYIQHTPYYPYGAQYARMSAEQQYTAAAAVAQQRMNMAAAAYSSQSFQSGNSSYPAQTPTFSPNSQSGYQQDGIFIPAQAGAARGTTTGSNMGLQNPNSQQPQMPTQPMAQMGGGSAAYMQANHSAMMEMYRRNALMRGQYYGPPQAVTSFGPSVMMYPPGAVLQQQQQRIPQQLLARRMPATITNAGALGDLSRKPGKPPPRRPPPRTTSMPEPLRVNKSSGKSESWQGKSDLYDDPDALLGLDADVPDDDDDDDDDYDPRQGSSLSKSKSKSNRRAKRRRRAGDESFEASDATSAGEPSQPSRTVSRRLAAQSNWATNWALDSPSNELEEAASSIAAGGSITSRPQRKRKYQSTRRSHDPDAEWVQGVGIGSSDNDNEAWTSDVESDLIAPNETSRIKRRKASYRPRQLVHEATLDLRNPQSPSTLEDDDDDDLGEGFSSHRKKPEVCVLDVPTATGPAFLGVDRVIGHRDDLINPETGEIIELPAAPSVPGTPSVADSRLPDSALPAEVSNSAPSTTDPFPPENAITVRRFCIKWQSQSHLHNSWLSYEELQQLQVAGIKKVSNYIKKQEQMEQKKLFMSEDEIEQMVIALELQRQLDQDALVPDRIVTHTQVDESVPEATTNVLTAHPAKITVILVKWTSCPYDQCTWETEPFMKEMGFAELIDSYYERESRIHGPLSAHLPLNQHDLSETSFEPYTSTPPYLGAASSLLSSAGSEPTTATSTTQAPAPPKLQLRDYQLTGVNWIISRMKKDLSVLLADEMGLGKTAQTISVVGHMMYMEKVAGPFLIVVPQSTMDNWLSEFHTWLPHANVVLFHGNPQAREIVRREEMKIVTAAPMSRAACDAFIHPRSKLTCMSAQTLRLLITNRVRYRCDVVITTTSILQCPEHLAHLRNVDWYFMAVDEAHQLKNRESKRFKELCHFKARYKLLLSGTPLHNNLEELWSLLHFMNPSIYNSLPSFQQMYSEVEKTASVGELKARQLNQLQRELSEVVLRRVKRDVLKSLPNKVEWILRVELSPKQSELCKDVVLRNYESLSKSTGGQKLSLQNICVELKKICNHPFLLHRPEDRETFNKELVWSSGKMCLLDKLLNRLKERGHRVLIFSQMVRMLNLLSTFLTIKGFRHQRLDGTMSRDVRKKAMDHFNAPNSDDFCFLLSTKAGGLGINLTSADTVIIYDSDWNPQNDLQAEARAHRIGQTKTVQIYRVVTKDSVEEDILERAKAKMVLDALVVQGLNVKAGIRENDLLNGTGGSGSKNFAFSREELTKILMFGATKLWNRDTETDQKPAAEEGLNIDLDAVLAEAEEHTTEGSGGRAEDLLSSFQNVSDFRYEAPKAKEEDKLAWDSIIPLEERLKFKSSQAPVEIATEAPLGRSRNKGGSQRAAAKRSAKSDLASSLRELEGKGVLDEDDYAVPDPDDYTTDEDDDSSDAPAKRRRGSKRGVTKGTRSAGPASRVGSRRSAAAAASTKRVLSDREKYKLSRAMIKYGTPAIRLEDVMKDARLARVDGQTVVEEANALLVQCQEELAAQCGESVRSGKLDDVDYGADRKKSALVTLQWGNGYTCPCRDLLERVKLLKTLHNVIAAQNIHTEDPWKMPSAELNLTLPDIPAFRPGDANILKGIYIHGFTNWQKMASDAGLAVGVDDFVKRVKSDKIKIKANRLLNALHSYTMQTQDGDARTLPVPEEEEEVSAPAADALEEEEEEGALDETPAAEAES
eukprot:Blabericola_migrator_1__8914@NODE_471_length_8214_cov_42_818706_g367_i0_p1_GENE_NODE_471_length_8214_cov_42_818706_g367_i0NODE_471_length_8214_cov_42_818706_g367_i0_p1_ORF_typecomplete_len1776_score357_02SNF2_N/PF00176_23/1_3e67HDA23/PF11496_8/1_7e22Helicase_C/PF00271_31/2_5e22ResIII/PF04851_15/6_6e14Chromo/PF00385_24/0_00097Chromo/PF00385_24/5e07ERCC3_RAD25_C/PF16203_5/3_7e10Cdh1_DBD_1/PF18196_1/7_7e03Cdh1_DBD_1/PF18196_1/5e05DEAD/PF00270_29/0_0024DEAD/PF00270_29/7_4e02CHDCT2/PF08074_11/8_8e03C